VVGAKRRFCSFSCPKNGDSYFQKKGFRVFWGVHGAMVCPKNGDSYFQKKGFRVFWGCMARWYVPKTGILISRKKVFVFFGGAWRDNAISIIESRP
jgi:hypothetical protein